MTAPIPTTLRGVRDGVCSWFGGPYDPATRTYRTPQVRNLGVVRRARPKSEDVAEFYLGADPGAVMGSWLWAHVDSGVEERAAVAGSHGLKMLRSAVVLHVFLRSNAEWAEDAQDAFYDLLDDLKDRLREDPAMGSGGFENGGFDAGEGMPWLRWSMAPAEVSAEVTRAYLAIEFDVRYFEIG